jgi:hypothetical protein
MSLWGGNQLKNLKTKSQIVGEALVPSQLNHVDEDGPRPYELVEEAKLLNKWL